MITTLQAKTNSDYGRQEMGVLYFNRLSPIMRHLKID
ncbi:MAG: hypothetical protein K0S11_746 [Gammaproteobacteria bacterium]|nr:hypothetical protein [Gammaproteobacteria bacterium]